MAISIAYAQGLFELTTENYPADRAIEAMKYLKEHLPDSPLAFGASVMGLYLSYGLSNIVQRLEGEACIPYLIVLDRLFKLNRNPNIAGAYCRALMKANEGMWYTFVLSELAIISRYNYTDGEGISLNVMILAYLDYLMNSDSSYTQDQIEFVREITKKSM